MVLPAIGCATYILFPNTVHGTAWERAQSAETEM